jgi:hypothetical protein
LLICFVKRPLPTEEVKLDPQMTKLRFIRFVVVIVVPIGLIKILIIEPSLNPVTYQGFNLLG